MVAAATALCLDHSTNVHRQSAKKSAAFVSLADAVDQTMALNFGVSAAGKLINSSPPVPTNASKNGKMDTLLVTNPHLQAMPQISPGTAALRKINEVLARSNSSAASSPATPSSQQSLPQIDENSPGSNAELVVMAEQFKERLMKEIDNNNFTEVGTLIHEIETARLSKSALEISRIGAVVNTLRRNIQTSHPDLARKCRSLIKSWRSSVESLNCSSRPSSSCGSSSVTPSLVSPALRLVTPRGGKTITPTSQLANEGFNSNASYAPSSNKTSPQLMALKRKGSAISPNANNKRAKISPTVTPTQPISVIEARRNVQSTESLLAAMGMENLLSSSIVEKKTEEIVQINGLVKSDSITVPSIQSPPEKRGRKKKVDVQQAPIVSRLKIRFGGKSAEEHDADETIEKTDIIVPDALPSTSTAAPSNRHPSVSIKKSSKKAKEPAKPEFSWYDKLPTVEELEMRSQKPTETVVDETVAPTTDPSTMKYRDRTLILMPYLEDGEPDFLLYDYPNKERFMAAKKTRRF